MTSRNTLVMPSQTSPDRPRASRRYIVVAIACLIALLGVVLVYARTDDDSDTGSDNRLPAGGQLMDGEALTAGAYSFGLNDGALRLTHTLESGETVECWTGETTYSGEHYLVTLRGLVKMRGNTQPISTLLPQDFGASAPQDFALQLDAADGTVHIGNRFLANCTDS